MNERKDENEGTEIARRAAKQWLAENELVPLSVLELDHAPPVGGWGSLGVEVVEDDLLRPAIRREDARRLVQERRDRELAAERPETVEAPLVAVGIPAIEGGTPVEALTSRDPAYKTPAEEFGARPKPNFLDDELAAGARQLAAAKAEAEKEGRDK